MLNTKTKNIKGNQNIKKYGCAGELHFSVCFCMRGVGSLDMYIELGCTDAAVYGS
jgi:hypothetical protein